MQKLTYLVEMDSAISDYCFEFVFDILGIPAEKIHRDAHPHSVDIYYGNSPGSIEYALRIPSAPEDRLWSELLSGTLKQSSEIKDLPFDIISAIGAFLTDEVNDGAGADAYDKHGRLAYARSYQASFGIAAVPVVNVYTLFLGSLIEEKIGLVCVPLWPNGKKSAIGLSHDIDIPEKYAYVANFRLTKNLISDFPVCVGKLFGLSLRYLFDRNRDEFWLFHKIAREEKLRGFSSTFFFAAVNSFGKWGCYNDVAYDISSDRFKRLFPELTSDGFDIGLHVAYHTHLDEERLEWEKNRLSENANVEVAGLRHHWWHLGLEPERTMSMHSKTGFRYDSSIAFNDDMGFRRGVALPYYPWIAKDHERTNCLQLPMFCMDGNLFYQNTELDEAMDRVKTYLAAIKSHSGVGVIDWHGRTSHPDSVTYHTWGEAYLRILDLLACDSDIWVANLCEITDWWDERRALIHAR